MAQQPQNEGPTLLDWILARWRARWMRRAGLVALGGLVLWGASWLERGYYAAEVKLMYVEQPGLWAAELLSRDPVASSLQSLGLAAGGQGPRLPEILRSRSLLRALLDTEVDFEGGRVPVFRLYLRGDAAGDEGKDRALERVRRRYLEATYDARTDVVRLQLLAPTAKLAAELANELTTRLNGRLVENSTAHARRQKDFIEERLASVKQDLEAAEVRLREFREENRAISDSPALRLEEGRRLRQVQLNEQLYTTLAAQYELAKIEEVKNLPVIDVIDPATPPHRRAMPRRGFRLAAGLALAALLVVVWDATTYLRSSASSEG